MFFILQHCVTDLHAKLLGSENLREQVVTHTCTRYAKFIKEGTVACGKYFKTKLKMEERGEFYFFFRFVILVDCPHRRNLAWKLLLDDLLWDKLRGFCSLVTFGMALFYCSSSQEDPDKVLMFLFSCSICTYDKLAICAVRSGLLAPCPKLWCTGYYLGSCPSQAMSL